MGLPFLVFGILYLGGSDEWTLGPLLSALLVLGYGAWLRWKIPPKARQGLDKFLRHTATVVMPVSLLPLLLQLMSWLARHIWMAPLQPL